MNLLMILIGQSGSTFFSILHTETALKVFIFQSLYTWCSIFSQYLLFGIFIVVTLQWKKSKNELVRFIREDATARTTIVIGSYEANANRAEVDPMKE